MLSRLKEMLNPEGCVAVHLIEGKENLYTALKYVYSKVFELVRVSSVEGLASKVLFAKHCSVCFIHIHLFRNGHHSFHNKYNTHFTTNTPLPRILRGNEHAVRRQGRAALAHFARLTRARHLR